MIKKLIDLTSHEIEDTRILMRNVPSVIMVFLCISVVLMNLLANKELLNMKYLALDCGFVVSWMSFLAMDVLTRQFGPKAAIKFSLFSIIVNFIVSILLGAISLVPGNWSLYYDYGDSIVNEILDKTIGGTWYIVCGSMLAFALGSIVNAIANHSIGKKQRRLTYKSFAIRSFTSTALGQFIDNLVFACVISHVFFGWTFIQVITCSITGAIFELLAEIVFSPIGYRICKSWDKNDVGYRYIHYSEDYKTKKLRGRR